MCGCARARALFWGVYKQAFAILKNLASFLRTFYLLRLTARSLLVPERMISKIEKKITNEGVPQKMCKTEDEMDQYAKVYKKKMLKITFLYIISIEREMRQIFLFILCAEFFFCIFEPFFFGGGLVGYFFNNHHCPPLNLKGYVNESHIHTFTAFTQ